MARGACTFKQSDVAKALKAAKDAGVPVSRFEIDRAGKIVVLIGPPDKSANLPTSETENDFGG